MQVAHGSLLEDLHSLRRKFDDTKLRDVSGDIVLLCSDINFILEMLGTLTALAEESRALQENNCVNTGRSAACFETLEARSCLKAEATDKDAGPHHSNHHSPARPRHRDKN